jgi:hypothetical protein
VKEGAMINVFLMRMLSSLLAVAAFLILRSDDCTALPSTLSTSSKTQIKRNFGNPPLYLQIPTNQRRDRNSGLKTTGSSSSPLYSFAFGKGKEDDLSPLLPLYDFASKDFLRSPITTAVPLKESMAIIFLQHELKLSERTLMNVIVNHSSLMYLRVDTNLRPTIEVFRSFGFKDKDIRSMVEQTPSVLAINHEWTLPEKLISLQSMFNLNKINLVKVVVKQPFLLTSSIERNLEISEFFMCTVGLSKEQTRALLLHDPRVAMTTGRVLDGCWSLLTDLYGLSDQQARGCCMRCPLLFSRAVLKDVDERVRFFCEELGLAPLPPSDTEDGAQAEGEEVAAISPIGDDIHKLVMRYPQLFYLDVDVFLRPNARLLRDLLGLDAKGLARLLGVFPQLLGYNPETLSVLCKQAMFLLTGVDFDEEEAQERARATAMEEEDEEEDEDEDEDALYGSWSLWGEDHGKDGGVRGTGSVLGTHLKLHHASMVSQAVANALSTKKGANNSLRPPSSYLESGSGEDESSVDGGSTEFLFSMDDIFDKNLTSSARGNEVGNRGINLDDGDRDGLDKTNIEDDEDGYKVKGKRKAVSSGQREEGSTPDLDLLADIVGGYSVSLLGQDNDHRSEEVQMVARCVAHFEHAVSCLSLPKDKAVKLLCAAPWVLSYRPERSQRVLATLAVTLGMNKAEVEKCVSMYPRLLSLGVDGKLHTLLRELARAAMADRRHFPPTAGEAQWYEEDYKMQKGLFTCEHEDQERYILHHRNHWLRSLVRQVVLKYPPVLGTSMNKVTERIHAMELIYMNAKSAPSLSLEEEGQRRQWSDEFVTTLRRTPGQHDRWVLKQQLTRRALRIEEGQKKKEKEKGGK